VSIRQRIIKKAIGVWLQEKECRNDFCHPFYVAIAQTELKDVKTSETAEGSLRSITGQFNYITHCYLCGEIGINDRKRKNPDVPIPSVKQICGHENFGPAIMQAVVPRAILPLLANLVC
jgi:hypothetical protein